MAIEVSGISLEAFLKDPYEVHCVKVLRAYRSVTAKRMGELTFQSEGAVRNAEGDLRGVTKSQVELYCQGMQISIIDFCHSANAFQDSAYDTSGLSEMARRIITWHNDVWHLR